MELENIVANTVYLKAREGWYILFTKNNVLIWCVIGMGILW